MIHQFGFVSEETFAEKMDTQNAYLLALVEAQGGTLKPTSWANVQALVRAGLAGKVFSIGDQLVCKKGNNDLVWDIIGFDHDTPTDSQFTHSLTLQLHDCLPDLMQFAAPQALYYAEDGLEAGTYCFTIQNYETSSGGGKTYQFTLENDVPAGGQITFGWAVNTNAADAKITSYASPDSATPIEQVSVIEGNSGTSLGTTDGTSTNLNFIQRVRMGSNNYDESAIRQYLNSSAAAGSVWSFKNRFDRPPTWASNTAGFMNGIDSDFLAVLGNAQKVTALNTVTDGGGSVTIDDKFFLLSRSEVYGGLESGVNEGNPYPYYSDYSNLPAAGIASDSNRIKYKNDAKAAWWLRSPSATVSNIVKNITNSGSVSGNNIPVFNMGIVPACNII